MAPALLALSALSTLYDAYQIYRIHTTKIREDQIHPREEEFKTRMNTILDRIGWQWAKKYNIRFLDSNDREVTVLGSLWQGVGCNFHNVDSLDQDWFLKYQTRLALCNYPIVQYIGGLVYGVAFLILGVLSLPNTSQALVGAGCVVLGGYLIREGMRAISDKKACTFVFESSTREEGERIIARIRATTRRGEDCAVWEEAYQNAKRLTPETSS